MGLITYGDLHRSPLYEMSPRRYLRTELYLIVFKLKTILTGRLDNLVNIAIKPLLRALLGIF